MQIETFPTRLEQILQRELDKGQNSYSLSGFSSLAPVAALLTNKNLSSISNKQNVFIFPEQKSLNHFHDLLHFFNQDFPIFNFPAYDVSPYSGLYPSNKNSTQRMNWLVNAQTGAQTGADACNFGIFTITIDALSQKTISPETLQDHLVEITPETTFDSKLIQQMKSLGYMQTPLVEDCGTFSIRGGIVDIFSPAHDFPIRIELFGDLVESLRFFSIETQRSLATQKSYILSPIKEVFYTQQNNETALSKIQEDFKERNITDHEAQNILFSLAKEKSFLGIEFMLQKFFQNLTSPLEHFLNASNLWIYDPFEISRCYDGFQEKIKTDSSSAKENTIYPSPVDLFFTANPIASIENLENIDFTEFHLSKFHVIDGSDLEQTPDIEFKTSVLQKKDNWIPQITSWFKSDKNIFISCFSSTSANRLKILLENNDLPSQIINNNELLWNEWLEQTDKTIFLLIKRFPQSVFLQEDNIIFLNESELTGKRSSARAKSSQQEFQKKASVLSFGDLKEGDLVVHAEHGIAIYEGLEIMNISGVDSEFVKLSYKDDDKLFLPIYRINQIQKYSNSLTQEINKNILDKLGNNKWAQTKTKVKNKLRDLAADLLKLYAEREKASRPPFSQPGKDFVKFEEEFPFEETPDQLKSINSIIEDMVSEKPMDRLVCGDVGFGKTEIAMRAAFKCVEDKKQVAILVPTTVLSFQHLESFKNRFKNWPIKIRAINRFLSKKEITKTLEELKDGSLDIIIGTHRLLSKDIQFNNLGLLIVDEEQKFGVLHKEKIKQLKASADTLAMSATPIPRTLNMSLMGIRDFSLINTAPVDRLPTRTFVCKPNHEIIRKSVQSEVDRGGQVFFLHNRVQSIYSVAEELKSFLPEIRIKVAHGQMKDQELEEIIVAFFNHEIDMLVCTTIIESGIDIPRANTMFIDKANNFGLSQLYQLRGRVGRSRSRAYCYLLLPKSGNIDQEGQNRLKIIQENTALGSGIKIAQYDLELRGTGNILGESQSGHINAIGYELYNELLEEAIKSAKGEELRPKLEPEINIRIPAFIPDNYIKDIRSRLAYYKALSHIETPYDIDNIEDELRDQFGKIPEPTLNLMGLMLIRLLCKKLCVKDVSSSKGLISLSFTEHTPLPVEEVLKLTNLGNKKYSLTPDSRLRIRMKEVTWPLVYDELIFLEKKCN